MIRTPRFERPGVRPLQLLQMHPGILRAHVGVLVGFDLPVSHPDAPYALSPTHRVSGYVR